MEKLGLASSDRGVAASGMRKEEEPEDEDELHKEDATAYRGMVARANYLAQDRLDIQYAVKECSRAMANPTMGDWKKLKRLASYLVDKKRIRLRYGIRPGRGRSGCGLTRIMPGVGRPRSQPAAVPLL